MALFRYGTVTVASSGVAQNLNLGFIPSVFTMRNITKLTTPTNGVNEVYWDTALSALATPATMVATYTGGAPAWSALTTTGISPFITPDSSLYVPNQAPYTTITGDRVYINQSTSQVIATVGNITQAVNALVTCGDNHGFTTAADVGVTVVTFHGVPGMTQINGVSGVIQSVPSATTFTVSINSSNFSAYNSTGKTQGVNAGFFNVITGAPPTTLYGNVSLPTAQANLGFSGLTLGTGVMVTANDVWSYQAIAQSPVTGP